MPDRRLQRHRQAVHPERTLDLLVSEVPEVSIRPATDVPRMLRSAPRLRRGALLIRGPFLFATSGSRLRDAPPKRRCAASGTRELVADPWFQETSAAVFAGVCKYIAGAASGATGNAITTC